MYVKVASSNDAINLSNLLKDGDWMVLYYADWCGHCQHMKPEWQKVVNKMKSSNMVNVAEIESSHIGDLVNKPQVNGFPTIKMYNNGNEKANFEDERVADKMEKFAMSNATKSTKTHIYKPLVKKISNGYIKPMKKIINSLSRKKRTMKNPMKMAPMKMAMPILHKKPTQHKKPTHHKKHTQHKKHTHYKKPTKHKKHTLHKKPTKHKKKSTVSKPKVVKSNTNFRNSTKDVYTQLIKSFNRIGKEAKQDSILLKQATTLI